jgi:hypothetical protein
VNASDTLRALAFAALVVPLLAACDGSKGEGRPAVVAPAPPEKSLVAGRAIVRDREQLTLPAGTEFVRSSAGLIAYCDHLWITPAGKTEWELEIRPVVGPRLKIKLQGDVLAGELIVQRDDGRLMTTNDITKADPRFIWIDQPAQLKSRNGGSITVKSAGSATAPASLPVNGDRSDPEREYEPVNIEPWMSYRQLKKVLGPPDEVDRRTIKKGVRVCWRPIPGVKVTGLELVPPTTHQVGVVFVNGLADSRRAVLLEIHRPFNGTLHRISLDDSPESWGYELDHQKALPGSSYLFAGDVESGETVSISANHPDWNVLPSYLAP